MTDSKAYGMRLSLPVSEKKPVRQQPMGDNESLKEMLEATQPDMSEKKPSAKSAYEGIERQRSPFVPDIQKLIADAKQDGFTQALEACLERAKAINGFNINGMMVFNAVSIEDLERIIEGLRGGG